MSRVSNETTKQATSRLDLSLGVTHRDSLYLTPARLGKRPGDEFHDWPRAADEARRMACVSEIAGSAAGQASIGLISEKLWLTG